MAWNEPGNRNDSPWGKRPGPSANGRLDVALKNFQKRLESLLGGGGSGTGGDGAGPGTAGGGGSSGLLFFALGALVLLWLASGDRKSVV
jgi:membrane protease subunit HflK